MRSGGVQANLISSAIGGLTFKSLANRVHHDTNTKGHLVSIPVTPAAVGFLGMKAAFCVVPS